MSRDAHVRCVGCRISNSRPDRARLAWWYVDVLAGVGVCRACSYLANAEQLRELAKLEGTKARAMSATLHAL